MLSKHELEKYDRQIMLKGFGEKGQESLKNARVFIAGAGGLGSPVSIYLAAAGVGNITIVDCDTVSVSNLNRQILHWEADIGRPKVESAKEKLSKFNPDIRIDIINEEITENNVFQLVGTNTMIVDAMDNIHARLLLNKVSLQRNIPIFHGAVYGFEGRTTTILPGKTPCLRCLYRQTLSSTKFPVVGVAPAIIACIQATEVLKYITGIGELLAGRLLIFDGMRSKFMEIAIKKKVNCEDCGQFITDVGGNI